MLSQLIGNHPSFSVFTLRVVLGVIMIAHGYTKLFKKDYGPMGFSGFLKSLGFPAPLFFTYIVGIVEFFGSLLLIVGFATRYAAVAIAINMLVALIKVKAKTGLVSKVMNGSWVGGYELDLALLAMAFGIAIIGAGKISIDFLLFGQW
jgi:putative oxidoreductase